MKKNVGLTYGEFSFPAEQGFTGSAGVHKVKGYMRGGHVKKTGTANANKGGHMKYGEGGYYGKPGDKYPKLKSGPRGKQGTTLPRNVKKRGGTVKKALGGYMGPEREIAVDDVTISVPKKHGGKMSMHDKLYKEGGKMGYAQGGQVKDTSGEFVEKRGKQDTMDHGVQPARRGRNQAEIEAGGTKRLKPGMQAGGAVALSKGAKKAISAQVRRIRGPKRIAGTGRTARAMTGLVRRDTKNGISKALKASKKGMPKNVKAKGGLAKYAHGGPTRKPYTGYNKQPGGSGNEDARYMNPKK